MFSSAIKETQEAEREAAAANAAGDWPRYHQALQALTATQKRIYARHAD